MPLAALPASSRITPCTEARRHRRCASAAARPGERLARASSVSGAAQPMGDVIGPPPPAEAAAAATGIGGFVGIHHAAVCVANLDVSLAFYCGVLGASRARAVRRSAGASLLRGAFLLWLLSPPLPSRRAPAGLPLNPARPGLDKLPYRGAWLWTGALSLQTQLGALSVALPAACATVCRRLS
jgi:hypothetical protein